ncbi:DUF4857 domain-containing protein [Thiococcus pfennigii]|uniref:DUF4857 domain-containing protein n=1 Tax=Thiococcus pfennigii TaxID=1057 RepID=UPI00190812AA|nr:DUF4857 domain-containing protein [Thiococcus pfennigii]
MRFPVRAALGRVSILKPFDAGWFLIADDGALFQLRRVDDRPAVSRVSLPEGLAVRHIKVAENRRHEVLGLLLADDDRPFLLGDGEEPELIPLALPGYAPERMELEILFDPLYRTAVYSDEERIQAVVMDRDHAVLDRYARTMAMAEPRLADRVFEALAPFHLTLREPTRRYLALTPAWHPVWSSVLGSAAAVLLATAFLRQRGLAPRHAAGDLALVALTGLYGLVALLLLPPARPPSG